MGGAPVTSQGQAKRCIDMAWSDKELREAELVYGPDTMNSDTYRLQIEATEEKKGKRLDIPGWIVGDEKGALLRLRAAKIIRERLGCR